MSENQPDLRPRILIVDDNPSIHDDFRKILGAKSDSQNKLDSLESELFGPTSSADRGGFRIDSAHQGQEALAMIQQSMRDGDPYVLAFVDVRMPPGWDGIESLEHIWKCTPELQAVICTAYSDYSWDEMTRRLGQTDNLLILKKPFETIEVLQLAHALTQKWALGRQAKLRMEDLDRMVRQRTEELVTANENLKLEIQGRVTAQEQLAISEERFSKAFHCSPNAVAILSSVDRKFLDFNHSFLDLSGYTAEQLGQSTDVQLQLWIRGTDSEPSLFGPGPQDRLRGQSCRLRRIDGQMRHILLSSEPLSLGTTPCLLLIAEDITDHLKLEAQLRQAQKMEVIGRMAAGIAHEFNNVLTVIQGDVGLLQTAKANLDKQALLNQIMQASQRAAGFTKQLLAFSRKQVLQPRLLNVSDVVQSLRKMLGRLIGERFDIKLDCPNNLPCVRADSGGLEQVLINLALNARDAMPDGGIIEISTSLVMLDAAAAASQPDAKAGKFVCLSVTDHGCGMSADVIQRIFDPFFTTKDVGKGTGLGLSTIHGIVKQHEGWIDVASEIGRGSIFRIFLPATDVAPSGAAVTNTGTTTVVESGKGEVVLVVEDEMAVRELACAALQKRGYQVLKGSNGPEAVQVWEQFNGQIHLLLTDMVMPNGMSGGDLARALQARSPDLKVLYTSGYSPEIWRKDSLLAMGINFLPKPYDIQTLLKAVRICLDGGKLPQHEVRPAEASPAR
jgi:two-component system cell cycle sensor histidine kinase/response regulator CckA